MANIHERIPFTSQMIAYHNFRWREFFKQQFLERKNTNRGSKIYHLTVTYAVGRFRSGAWEHSVLEDRDKLIDKHSEQLHKTFRAWYIRMLKRIIPHYSRKAKRPLQPFVVSFIDDRGKGEEVYPHLHSIMFVPSQIVEKFEEWTNNKGHVREWGKIEVGGTINIQHCDSQEYIENAITYASKYMLKRGNSELDDGLFRHYPDV